MGDRVTTELSKLRDKLHSATSWVKCIEEILKKEGHRIFLCYQLTDQEHLANSTYRKVEKLEKMRTKAMAKACKKSFFIGFDLCKSMTQAFLPNNHTELLRANPSDGSQKAMVDDCIEAFAKSSEHALSTNNFHATT